MKEHHLQLNLAQTELLVFPATPNLKHGFTIQLGSSTITPSSSVRNCGVIFDDQLTFKDHITKTARSCWFALQNIRKIRPHNFLSRPLSFVGWNTAMLFWLDFHHAQPNLYKWFRMQRHDWSSTSPKGPTLHPSLSPCTGYLLWLALSLRHWCLRIEQPQVQPPSTSTHSYRSTFPPEAWDLKVSDASWCHHREAQNHFPEHFRSLFLAGAMIFPPPSGMLNAWQFSTAENSSYSSRFNCIPKKKMLSLSLIRFCLACTNLNYVWNFVLRAVPVPLYDESLVVFLNCKSLWMKASAKLIM